MLQLPIRALHRCLFSTDVCEAEVLQVLLRCRNRVWQASPTAEGWNESMLSRREVPLRRMGNENDVDPKGINYKRNESRGNNSDGSRLRIIAAFRQVCQPSTDPGRVAATRDNSYY
jgi:hypothetical protein